MPVNAFVAGERHRATRWKRSTPDIPDEAREDAPYLTGSGVIDGPFGYCLPPAYAEHNLLPSARRAALDAFTRLAIPWHAGSPGGPSNHLLDSQVQCVNALAPHVDDPAAIKAMFQGTLPIGQVIDIENGWYVTFEWIGEHDHLGEASGNPRTRGSRTTSADGAIRYRTPEGDVEVALIEWKYTEDYTGRELSGGVKGLELRMSRYRPLWDDPDCPIDREGISYGDLFQEPLYQLFRLQLLADKMERVQELGANRARLVVAAPGRNPALAGHLRRWSTLVRRRDRFAVYDTDALLDPSSPAPADYRTRYG